MVVECAEKQIFILKVSPYKLLTNYKVKMLTLQWRILIDHHQEIKANITNNGTTQCLVTPDKVLRKTEYNCSDFLLKNV